MRVDTVGRTWITTSELKDVMYGGKIPEIEKYRRYLGKSVNTHIIEETIRNADMGFMRDIVDLGAETLRVDPHLSGIVSKRMRAVGSIKPTVTPVSGDTIDPVQAKFFADMVRRQLESIPRLKQKQINLAWSAWNGRSLLEIEWAETANSRERFRATNLHWIHPRRLSLGPEREIRINDSFFQGAGFEAIGFDIREIPFKFIQSSRQLFNEYPEREGLAIPSLFYSYFKRLDWRERLALLELYGKPLRWIETDPNQPQDPAALDEAKNTADDMGSDSAGALPPGMKLQVQALGRGAGDIHKEIIDDCNSELSKLVLGTTNTTDAQSGGLGSGQAFVHQDGESLVFTTDCDETAEDWTEGFARAVVHLNAGEEVAEVYTPKVELAYEIPPPPEAQLDRAKKFFDMGMPLKRSEIYERGGYTQPSEGDDVVLPPAAPAGLDPMGFSSNPSDTSNQEKEVKIDWRKGRIALAYDTTAEADWAQIFIQGIPITIDRPKGFVQEGIDHNGQPWSRTYSCDYGFIPKTEGGDGEALDVFIGPNFNSCSCYWVKQKKLDGSFDEYKLFIGFDSAVQALDTYGSHIPTKFFAGMEQGTTDQLKALLGIKPAPLIRATTLQRAVKVLSLIDLAKDELGK